MEIVVLIIRKTEPTINISKPRGNAFGFFYYLIFKFEGIN